MAKTIRVIKASIDFTNMTILISNEDQKRASVIGSPAYKEMRKMLKDYPGFTVAIKARKATPNKTTYKDLTYKNMEAYLQTAFSGDERQKKMEEYKYVRARAAACPSPFAFVRKWFLQTHSDYATLNVDMKGEVA